LNYLKNQTIQPMSMQAIKRGDILKTPKFNEPVRVVGDPRPSDGFVMLDLLGLRTKSYREGVIFTDADLLHLEIEPTSASYQSDPKLFKLGLEAVRIRLAYEYDPFFGLSISRVDPLPHQLDAVYNHLLKAWRCRFLLADDAGAGKTIMAGLLLKELKLRGLVERVLIICPANLSFQWRREMRDRFEEDFELITGYRLREAYAVNVWNQHPQVITSMDLAKLDYVLPSVKQAEDWDLVIVDEAHRMSARDSEHKSERYRLGEIMREKTTHFILLTGTPHKGDPDNFCLFLQLLDQEAYADVRSIQEAMQRREAPFYLRRTKEAMLSFPERQPDSTWKARKLFTKRDTRTVAFDLVGEEQDLYKAVSDYVKTQSQRAADLGDDRRARAIGFLMALYQRRMASSTFALKESLRRRQKKLRDLLEKTKELGDLEIPDIPAEEEWEEMDAAERESFEERLEQVSLARRKPELEAEIKEIEVLIGLAQKVEDLGHEVKLRTLREQLTQQGIFADRNLRLLLFTEYKDTLDYLVRKLREWGLTVGFIHGGMKAGNRDEPGTRLHAERQFWDLGTQVLVATEAAGEGINLQCCNVLFNYDIPWNPNRLEQRMGRIHRYGQKHDCLIFNFFAQNTVEGRVLQKLLDKLQEIRDALESDSVFDVVGEVVPSNQVERLLREFYAGDCGEEDVYARLEVIVNKDDFEHICYSALEGLAKRTLNLPMLVEQRALARERRIVPETIFRFFREAAVKLGLEMRQETKEMSLRMGRLPLFLYDLARGDHWRLPPLAKSYGRITFDRGISEADPRFEWVTPGHPLFEVVRRKIEEEALPHLRQGALFYELDREEPSLLELFSGAVADGTGKTHHQRLFVVETDLRGAKRLREPSYLLGLISPESPPGELLETPPDTGSQGFLFEQALKRFLKEVAAERQHDLDLVEMHVSLCFAELIQKRNDILSRHLMAKDQGDPAAEGLINIESEKLMNLIRRRDQRLQEITQQRALSLQGVERLGVGLVLPHPERDQPEVSHMVPDPATEGIAMETVMAHEEARGCKVEDVHHLNWGYDVRSLHPNTGELRLIEVKGLKGATGSICLTPNEKRVAEDRRDIYWLYIVTNCKDTPTLHEPITDPARLEWHEVRKVDYYSIRVDTSTGVMRLFETRSPLVR
jgi:superfamily II DNA or RNA helicase